MKIVKDELNSYRMKIVGENGEILLRNIRPEDAKNRLHQLKQAKAKNSLKYRQTLLNLGGDKDG